jgi:hypothetical protein
MSVLDLLSSQNLHLCKISIFLRLQCILHAMYAKVTMKDCVVNISEQVRGPDSMSSRAVVCTSLE